MPDRSTVKQLNRNRRSAEEIFDRLRHAAEILHLARQASLPSTAPVARLRLAAEGNRLMRTHFKPTKEQS